MLLCDAEPSIFHGSFLPSRRCTYVPRPHFPHPLASAHLLLSTSFVFVLSFHVLWDGGAVVYPVPSRLWQGQHSQRECLRNHSSSSQLKTTNMKWPLSENDGTFIGFFTGVHRQKQGFSRCVPERPQSFLGTQTNPLNSMFLFLTLFSVRWPMQSSS